MSLADPNYISFNEVGDVLASVDVIAVLAPTLGDNPLRWKWVILAAHSAMQGAMVCAYADSANTSILSKKSEAKMWAWFNNRASRKIASAGELCESHA